MPSPETPMESTITQNVDSSDSKPPLDVAASTGSGIVAVTAKEATSDLEREAAKAAKSDSDSPNVVITSTKAQDLGNTGYGKANKSQDIINAKHVDEIDEDREIVTHFKTWGKPEARDLARKHSSPRNKT